MRTNSGLLDVLSAAVEIDESQDSKAQRPTNDDSHLRRQIPRGVLGPESLRSDDVS